MTVAWALGTTPDRTHPTRAVVLGTPGVIPIQRAGLCARLIMRMGARISDSTSQMRQIVVSEFMTVGGIRVA